MLNSSITVELPLTLREVVSCAHSWDRYKMWNTMWYSRNLIHLVLRYYFAQEENMVQNVLTNSINTLTEMCLS